MCCFQRITYETKKPVHDVRTIAEVEGGVVKAGKELEWKEQIIIPPLPQSSLVGCSLIKIEYYVKVRAPCLSLLLLYFSENVTRCLFPSDYAGQFKISRRPLDVAHSHWKHLPRQEKSAFQKESSLAPCCGWRRLSVCRFPWPGASRHQAHLSSPSCAQTQRSAV